MKTTRFLGVAALCSAAMVSPAHAALMGLTKDVTSPSFADFTANGLDVKSTYNSSTGIATFHAGNHIVSGNPSVEVDSYTSHPSSPGTQGAYNNTSFNGFYSIDATIQKVNNVWTLTGGTVTIQGSLLGGANTDLLLQGSLRTGASGAGGAFGYQDPGLPATQQNPNYDIFEFRFTPTSGSSKILADYFGVNSGQAGIILDANFTYVSTLFFNGDWTRSFSSINGAGVADAFVPEPVAYPLAAGVAALSGLLFVRRKSSNLISAAAV
jgi:hypothetical protein